MRKIEAVSGSGMERDRQACSWGSALAGIGLKSNSRFAPQAVNLDNSDHNAYFIKRARNCRSPQDKLQDFCAHALGCDSGFRRRFTLRLLLRHVLSFSARPALGDDHSGFYLLGQHFLEHQRHLSQFHSQSIFPFAAAQSLFQYLGINHRRLQPNFLRMHSHAASQRERRPPGRARRDHRLDFDLQAR